MRQATGASEDHVKEAVSEADLEALSDILGSLAHPRRLELLSILRQPLQISEIELRPWRRAADHNPERSISRSAVERHLQTLESIGVVTRRNSMRTKGVDEYVLDHARLFATIESVRALTRLRPTVDLDSRETMDAVKGVTRQRAFPRAGAPEIIIMGGPREGEAASLAGQGPWRVGRTATSDIILDYDPFVSSNHAEITRTREGFAIQDLPSNRNGTALNWLPLARGVSTRLASGDVVGVGRSLLLFRESR